MAINSCRVAKGIKTKSPATRKRGIFSYGVTKPLQCNLLFGHHFAQVNQPIAHTTQSSVDTALC